MNWVRLLISLLLLTMMLSCGACGKKGPPILPQEHFSGIVSGPGGEKTLINKN